MKKNINEHIFFKNIFLSYCIFLYNQTINEEIVKHIDHELIELKKGINRKKLLKMKILKR